MKQALLIIDIQNDYFEGGKIPIPDSEKAATNAAKALQYCRNARIDVIHIQHIDVENQLPFFQPGTFGVEIYDLVKPIKDEPCFIKHTPNAFNQTKLLSYLQEKGITNLVICGMMTHMCVDATVRAAKDFNFKVSLLADACTTTDMVIDNKTIEASLVHNIFIEAIGQYYATITSTDNFCC